MRARLNLWIPAILMVMAACGDEDNGNEDTLLTGVSGVLILVIVVWLIVRAVRKRS